MTDRTTYHGAMSTDESVKSVLPGAQLGPYRVEARLGAGGMGDVFRARDTRLGRTVAIKVIRPEFSQRADFITVFSAKPAPSRRSTIHTCAACTMSASGTALPTW